MFSKCLTFSFVHQRHRHTDMQHATQYKNNPQIHRYRYKYKYNYRCIPIYVSDEI